MEKDMINFIHNESIENNVPIIKDEGLKKILEIISQLHPKKILEIGTAVGYSAIVMAKNSNAFIDTIERNKEMYEKALLNIKMMNLTNRIHVFYSDALKIDIDSLQNDYDLIFIDAAKAQYKNFFNLFSPLLNKNGVIITDNIYFHGLVKEYESTNTLSKGSKDLKALVRKISSYNEWLKNNTNFKTEFFEIGDGIAVSVKR